MQKLNQHQCPRPCVAASFCGTKLAAEQLAARQRRLHFLLDSVRSVLKTHPVFSICLFICSRPAQIDHLSLIFGAPPPRRISCSPFTRVSTCGNTFFRAVFKRPVESTVALESTAAKKRRLKRVVNSQSFPFFSNPITFQWRMWCKRRRLRM